MAFTLLTYNIRRGGLGHERFLAGVIRESGADLVLLQEATAPHVVRQIAAATAMTAWDARPGHSLAFLSRIAIESHAWHRPPGTGHAFLEIIPEGLGLRVFGLHLTAVHSNWTEWARMLELRAILKAVKSQRDQPHVVAGDFNTLAPGERLDVRKLPLRLRPMVWLSGGQIRWRTIQMMLDAGYCDAWRTLHRDAQGLTFPTWGPHVRLDYAFISNSLAGGLQSCQVITAGDAPRASDHFPVLTSLALP